MIYDSIIAVDLDIKLYRGDKFTFNVKFWEDEELTIPFDLTPFTGTLKMQIKRELGEPRAIATLDEANGGLALGTEVNELLISAFGMNKLIPAYDYFYDAEGLYSGDRLTFLKGRVLIVEDVTR